MTANISTQELESLASAIGDAVYLDITKWHLYLNDAHLHTPLAEKLYPLLLENQLSRKSVAEVLQEMTVAIGAGRRQVSLLDFIPPQSEERLLEVLEEYQRENL
jgi:hypothetical protein